MYRPSARYKVPAHLANGFKCHRNHPAQQCIPFFSLAQVSYSSYIYSSHESVLPYYTQQPPRVLQPGDL